jgi:hypothetical protein
MRLADAGYCGDELLIKIELKKRRDSYISMKEHDIIL